MVPKSPPITEYIAAIEQACTALQQGKAEELKRGDEGHHQENTAL